MAGIAGILKQKEKSAVRKMLEKISHRGSDVKKIFELEDATIGIVWSYHEDQQVRELAKMMIFRDGPGYGHSAEVARINNKWELHRDLLGVAPLYISTRESEPVMFASEAKALLPFPGKIVEMPPGYILTDKGLLPKGEFEFKGYLNTEFPLIANELRILLRNAIKKRIHSGEIGVFLSGGIDSSSVAALARPLVKKLHSFSGGLKDSNDLLNARQAAGFINTEHHEVIITPTSAMKMLPDVIYHLESFDPYLVRSGIVNLSISYAASKFVSEILSGDGADELFGGYESHRNHSLENLNLELLSHVNLLHNSTFQRLDRCTSAFGLTAYPVFTDLEVMKLSFSIPPELKIRDCKEKWILRVAMENLLPTTIIERKKEKFWEGTGLGTMIEEQTHSLVSDHDFRSGRKLDSGYTIETKEEYMYYRIFKEHFGDNLPSELMGRSIWKQASASVTIS